MMTSSLELDLTGLETENIEVLFQEASKGMPAFAASTGGSCTVACACSCTCLPAPVEDIGPS